MGETESGNDEDSARESVFEPREHDTNLEQDGDDIINSDQKNESTNADKELESQASRTSKHFYGNSRVKWLSESFISRKKSTTLYCVYRLYVDRSHS